MEKKVKLSLENVDGNAFAIMGTWIKAAKRQKWSEEEIKQVIEEATSGDYDKLLQTIIRYTE